MKGKHLNQEGYILVTTLIVMVVLTIFGLALINLSSTEALQSKHYEKSLQSKYLAKSGADIMADYIINNTKKFEERYTDYENGGEDFTETFPIEIELNEGKAIVDVEKTGEGVTIISEGVFEKNKTKIKLFLKNIALGNEPLFHIPIEIVDSADTRYKPLSNIDTITPPEGKLIVEKNKNTTIDLTTGNKEYKQILVEEGGTLTLNTGGQDKILIVSKLDIKGYLALSQDKGRVFLIVREEATFSNSYKDSENQLVIFGMDFSTIKLTPTTDKNSFLYIYSPFGTTILGGGVEINGAIIVSKKPDNVVVDTESIRYRPLDKKVKLDGYIFYEASYIYKFDRYDNYFE